MPLSDTCSVQAAPSKYRSSWTWAGSRCHPEPLILANRTRYIVGIPDPAAAAIPMPAAAVAFTGRAISATTATGKPLGLHALVPGSRALTWLSLDLGGGEADANAAVLGATLGAVLAAYFVRGCRILLAPAVCRDLGSR